MWGKELYPGPPEGTQLLATRTGRTAAFQNWCPVVLTLAIINPRRRGSGPFLVLEDGWRQKCSFISTTVLTPPRIQLYSFD